MQDETTRKCKSADLLGSSSAKETISVILNRASIQLSIGHGRSAKPSDGLRAKFPAYNYDDMVDAQYRLVKEGLGVPHLRLVMGNSMGGMHTWVWATRHPEFMDALMPLACNPGPIIGRNRLWRDMIIDAIERDPDWKGGEYTTQPRAGMREALGIQLIAGSAPAYLHHTLTDRDTVDRYLQGYLAQRAVA